MNALNYPLTNAQIELMKLFGTDLSDDDLHELKLVLSKFYARKAIQGADDIWDQKALSDADMDELLNAGS